jgi:hypothetical protein
VFWFAAVLDVRAVTTVEDAAGGCDGIKNGRWGFHTASGEQDAWWQVDLGKEFPLDRVVIFNRTDGSCAPRTSRIRVLVAGSNGDDACKEFKEVYQHDGTTFFGVKENKPLVVDLKDKNVAARIVRLQVPGRCSFALDEVEVYGKDDPKKNIALGRPADQKSVGPHSFPGTLSDEKYAAIYGPKPAPSAPAASPAAPSVPATLDRLDKLAERLRRDGADPKRLDPLAAELAKLNARLVDVQAKGSDAAAMAEIESQARALGRKIAFTNPLLTSIDKLLFITRHDAVGVYHMCDQFYGCNAKPGGGLFVLDNPFGPEPKLRNLLENSVVENGRLKGRKLDSGSFLSPEISFDGRTIFFAYSEATAFAKSQGKETYLWGPQISYHLFKCNADGTDLVQLTDGDWDDFDPCCVPNGRVAFVSLRRGGYLRCGRHCPVYTIFSMEPDGSDIVCLSYHETHEWQPSVNNDGMLVYTRWDYVDRDTNIAHHIWLSYPDGRDPRSYHGNYPLRRETRPWMEMDIRAIPGSNRYVATTGSHHGHALGSLVLIDHRPEDDLAMSQLERLTPEVAFPEASGKGSIRSLQQYATAWPLSENDFLCVYDPAAAHHAIYWIDRDGNRELIYRDEKLPCHSPMPLGPRPMPPVIPDATTQTASAKAKHGDRPATVAVMNLYDSDFDWPEGTKITDLRVIQVFPKSTAPPNQPRIGVANQTNARAVLGTVPVEEDGSVFFEAPVGKALYFQALDASGTAVQSMRSATYVHPGEKLVCQGCHERKHSPPSAPPKTPLAMRRAPSKLKPDASGSNPFNYPRLVQDVLDRNCAGCHREKKALDLAGDVDRNGFTRSYNNLAGKYGFYFNVSNGSINDGVHGGARTIPGKFGAKAAPLLKYLGDAHYGVKLSPEDFHRVALWLDCNSEFLGAYEDAAAQARGEPVTPSLE